ncbi:ABC transporter substrate-binding protein [Neisseriaceae bacterium JH1-16]|nr:ABC transporter substrate-binding protein [Neisseriaceae bacterium JH1-16]
MAVRLAHHVATRVPIVHHLAPNRMNTHSLVLLLPFAVAMAVPAAQAQSPERASPEALVQAAVEGVVGTIQANPDTRNGDITKITTVVQRQFLPYTDFQRTTRLAVGNAWRDATPEQRQQLFEQFQTLLVRSYVLSLTQLREQNIKFRYKPAQAGSNAADVVVETRVLNNGDETQIDYRLQRTPTGWKIYDINMMGAWLIEVYRQQFADILARGGVDGLLKYLSRHNAKQATGS